MAAALSTPLTAQPPAGSGEFIRADADGNSLIEPADARLTLAWLAGEAQVDCLDALDANDDGRVDLADPTWTLLYLFAACPAPRAPFPDCGPDPTPDDLGCDRAAPCELGGPMPGLTWAERAAFNRGRELFQKRFTPSEGLGPFFNTTSCVGCHETPTVGGSAALYRNFFLVALGPEGAQIPMPRPMLPSIVLPSFGPPGQPRPRIPDTVDGLPVTIAQRNGPPMFGTGLFELISNATIVSNADPDDTIFPDGISGRFNTDGLGNIGRFGFKAQANNIEVFIRGAAQNQMGLTTDPVQGSKGIAELRRRAPLQVAGSLDLPMKDLDLHPDPEIPVQDFADIIAFSRFLAPPRPLPLSAAAEAGRVRFHELGCAKCHIPSLPSARGPVDAYTDLLLHDMGPGLADGISMGFAQAARGQPFTTGSEFRTAPLWGVSLSAPYLHDGRAGTLDGAILWHGGEAQSIRDAYAGLSQPEKDQLIAFLESL